MKRFRQPALHFVRPFQPCRASKHDYNVETVEVTYYIVITREGLSFLNLNARLDSVDSFWYFFT